MAYFGNNMEDKFDKLFRKLDRGILSRREVVDSAFADLAYDGQFNLLIPLMKSLLQKGLGEEVRSWAEWDEDCSSSNFHYMPFNDSRLVIYHFGGPHDSTPEQQEELRIALRSRVKLLADMVRSNLDDLYQGGSHNP
jgi:hypothetical protein